MGWKLSDLLTLFPLREQEVANKTPSIESNSCRTPVVVQPPEPEKLLMKVTQSGPLISKDDKSSSSGPLPGASEPRLLTLEDYLKKGAYRVKIKKGIKKKDLFRFLMAKMLYEPEEGLHLDEFLVVWELYLQLLDINSKDPSFKEKYDHFFRNTVEFFRDLGSQREFPIRIEDCENSRYLERLLPCLEPMLPTRSAYFGLKGQKDLKSGFSLIFESELVRRKIPEGRRIGVGYRDKGSSRDLAFDGSPDWREVASSQIESRVQEVETYTRIPRESPDFDWDLVYNSQLHPWDERKEEDCPPEPDDLIP